MNMPIDRNPERVQPTAHTWLIHNIYQIIAILCTTPKSGVNRRIIQPDKLTPSPIHAHTNTHTTARIPDTASGEYTLIYQPQGTMNNSHSTIKVSALCAREGVHAIVLVCVHAAFVFGAYVSAHTCGVRPRTCAR